MPNGGWRPSGWWGRWVGAGLSSLLAALALIAVEKFHPLGFGRVDVGGGGPGRGDGRRADRGPGLGALDPAEAPGGGHRARPPLPIEGTRLQHVGDAGRGAGRREAGRALVEDAARRVRRIDVAEKFAVAPSRWILLPLLPAMAVLLVALLVSPAVVRNQAAANRPRRPSSSNR